jgi:hypothetical protein
MHAFQCETWGSQSGSPAEISTYSDVTPRNYLPNYTALHPRMKCYHFLLYWTSWHLVQCHSLTEISMRVNAFKSVSFISVHGHQRNAVCARLYEARSIPGNCSLRLCGKLNMQPRGHGTNWNVLVDWRGGKDWLGRRKPCSVGTLQSLYPVLNLTAWLDIHRLVKFTKFYTSLRKG